MINISYSSFSKASISETDGPFYKVNYTVFKNTEGRIKTSEVPFTIEDFSRVNVELLEKYGGNRVHRYEDLYTSRLENYYLIKGGIIQVKDSSTSCEVKVMHETKEGLVELLETFKLPFKKEHIFEEKPAVV